MRSMLSLLTTSSVTIRLPCSTSFLSRKNFQKIGPTRAQPIERKIFQSLVPSPSVSKGDLEDLHSSQTPRRN